MTSPTPDFYEFVNKLGTVMCLVIFVLGLYFEWWVMGREFRRLVDENKDLKAQAKADADTIQKSVHTAWQMVGTVRETVRPAPPGQ